MTSLTSLVLILFLAGCDQDSDEWIEEELGAYSFGVLVDFEDDEFLQFDYHGEVIKVPYHVEGFAEGIVSEFGWFLFVDGIPQLTHLETMEGEIFRESAYMHHFALEYREREEFYVVFTPVSGQIGEQVGVVSGALLQPNFMPEDVEHPFFYSFHNLASTLPFELSINSQVQNLFTVDTHVQLQPIKQEILNEEQRRFDISDGRDFDTWLAERTRIGLFPAESDLQLDYEGIILAENEEINLSLFVYGGEEIRSRITFFVNHQPVQVNGVDFIELQMEHGQMAIIDVTLSVDDFEYFNSLYAMMMATGEDYYQQEIFKTWSLLLVNEQESDR